VRFGKEKKQGGYDYESGQMLLWFAEAAKASSFFGFVQLCSVKKTSFES